MKLKTYPRQAELFYHPTERLHPFNDVYEDDRYDRVVDAAARQMVLVED